MKKTLGTVFVAAGLLFAASACTSARNAPNVSYLMGSYLPGIVLLAVGVKLRQQKKLPVSVEAENPSLVLRARRRSNAEMGVLGGIMLMFMGSGLSQQSRELFPLGTAVLLGGTILMIWGAANYMRWKGYSGWFGLLGLLLLPGLIILACFPNKMKDSDSPFSEETGKTWWVVPVMIVAVVLLILLPIAAFVAIPFIMSQMPLSRTPNAWVSVSSDPPKFTVKMPANPKRQVLAQQSPDGGSTATTYVYESHDDVATYTAGFMPFTPNPDPGALEERAERVLDNVLDSAAGQMKGRVLDRKAISLGRHLGKEQTIEFNPGVKNRAGESIVGLMIWKLYFLRDSILMMTVTLSKSDRNRPAVEDRIARFFNSLQVEQSGAPGSGP